MRSWFVIRYLCSLMSIEKLTRRVMKVFADGLYLELLSFKHEPSHYPPGSPARIKRDTHPWANKPLGWIDYAFLGNGSHTIRISDIINDRAKKDGSGAFYEAEENGGRKRTDGKVVRWLISTPQENKGTLPFFCGDITPRDLRVRLLFLIDLSVAEMRS